MSIIIPEQLRQSMSRGRTVLFAGAGMSRPQLPGWVELLERMLDWAAKESLSLDVASVRDLIHDNDLLLAAQELRTRLGDSELRRFLQHIFLDKSLQPGPVHRLLPEMGFAAVLTTNYDKLIENSFPPGTRVHTQLDLPELSGLSRDRDFAIVKVHGDVGRLDSIVQSPACPTHHPSGSSCVRNKCLVQAHLA